MYMLSVYHRGSVACHLPASTLRIHHLLSIKISRVRINLSHTQKYTLELVERLNDREGKKVMEKTVEVKGWQREEEEGDY